MSGATGSSSFHGAAGLPNQVDMPEPLLLLEQKEDTPGPQLATEGHLNYREAGAAPS
jgi:hypothetical protein